MEPNVFGVIITLVVAVVGTLITMKGLKSQAYKTQLHLSEYQPPGFVFGIAWTVIYALYMYTWYKYVKTEHEWIMFAINMILNLGWVWLFFGQNRYDQSILTWSKIIILVLFAVTLYQIYLMWQKVDLIAVIPLMLYAMWLLLATYLNFDVKLV